jgi:hypothetical protein
VPQFEFENSKNNRVECYQRAWADCGTWISNWPSATLDAMEAGRTESSGKRAHAGFLGPVPASKLCFHHLAGSVPALRPARLWFHGPTASSHGWLSTAHLSNRMAELNLSAARYAWRCLVGADISTDSTCRCSRICASGAPLSGHVVDSRPDEEKF